MYAYSLLIYIYIYIRFHFLRSNIANRRYSTFREVQEDILLMFSNCELYNDPNSDLARLARRLKKLVGPLEN